ncbi:MAG: phosphate uptake regulator PhoU [Rubrobacter sp.]|jgi:phosphate transport system protein|nr:phosphate uptake regulator PhoU [Rubrobacter sp.]
MPRESFQQELDNLVGDVLGLGKEVGGSLENTVRAMETRDENLATSELGVDVRYKARGAELERDSMILQARQAPVARDLRLLYTVQSVTNHLVRSGALSEHICHALAETAGAERDEDLEASLVEMARTARNIFNEGLDIFENRDIDRARNLQAKDDKVDLLYSEAMNLIANPSDTGAGAPEWRMRAALMVHYLERIADHGVDVGGSTVFLVTGQRIEDAMRQYLERDINPDGE